MKKAIDLDWCVARLTIEGTTEHLVIIQPSDQNETCFYPAQSIQIYGKKGLIALRDLLNEAYAMEAK